MNQFAFDMYDHIFADTQTPDVALSNAISSVSGGDQVVCDIQIMNVIPLTDPYTQFAFDGCDHPRLDTHGRNVALSNAISSVSGGDQGTIDTHLSCVTPLADPYTEFAFDVRDHYEGDIQLTNVALSNAIHSVSGGDQIWHDIQEPDVTLLTDLHTKFAFDVRDHCPNDIHGGLVVLSNAISSVGGGDHDSVDIQRADVTLLTDSLIKFAFDSCDHCSDDIQRANVALSNAIYSVGGGDQFPHDTQWCDVTPLTDPYTKFAFDGCDQFDDDIQTTSVALSNAIHLVSGGDQPSGAIHVAPVTPLTDPFIFDSCNQTCVDIHPAGIVLSNSVSGGDQRSGDTHEPLVTPLTDLHIQFALDSCDQRLRDIPGIIVTLSNAINSVSGGDQAGSVIHRTRVTPLTDSYLDNSNSLGETCHPHGDTHRVHARSPGELSSVSGGDHPVRDIHVLPVTPLTDPPIKFAFDVRDHFARDIHLRIVALSNALPSVSGGDHLSNGIHRPVVTSLADPFISLRSMYATIDRMIPIPKFVALSNASSSVSGGDHPVCDIHMSLVTLLTDPSRLMITTIRSMIHV